MPVAGNIAGLSIAEADLTARFPGLNEWRSPAQSDWTAQLAKGKLDALEAFRVAKGQDPTRAVAVSDDDWKTVLAHFTLAVCFRGFGPNAEWVEETARWRTDALDALSRFLYKYDENDTGTIEEDVADEESQRTREIVLRRG